MKSYFYCLWKCNTWNYKNESDGYGAHCSTVTKETDFKKCQQKQMNIISFPCNMKGLVFPSWVLSNTLRYYHHFPLSRSSPDTPQRAALSCTSAFAMLPWKHSHGIAHYRNRHLHITSEKLSGEDFNPRVKTLQLSFAQTLNLDLALPVQGYVGLFVGAFFRFPVVST